MTKYGMKFSTIRYYQQVSLGLYRTHGTYNGRGTLESTKLQTFDAQYIGHAAIALAAVASPEHLLAVITGTRGRRWMV